MTNSTRISIFIIAAPFALFFLLIWKDINPGGVLKESKGPEQISQYIDEFLPGERVKVSKTETTIVDEPVYISIHTPHTAYESITLEVEFANSGAEIIEIGAVKDIYSGALDLKPLQNTMLESLDWPSVSDGKLTLFDREGEFASIEEFQQAGVSREQIATYHTELQSEYLMASYQPRSAVQEIDVSLRGYHQFITYVKDEDLNLEILAMDMNRAVGEDDISIKVWSSKDELIVHQREEVDDNKTSNQIEARKTISVHETGLPEGVYRVELSGTSDIFWRTISTTQQFVTFIGGVYIGDDVAYLPDARQTTLVTNAKHVVLETQHADALQEVTIGASSVALEETHKKISHTVEDQGVVQVISPLSDIRITGNGKFAFTESAFFDPDPAKLSVHTDLEARGINYILADYTPPSQEDGLQMASATFQIADLPRVEGGYKFALSIPGIKDQEAEVAIKSISMMLEKQKLSAGEFLKEVRNRIPFGL